MPYAVANSMVPPRSPQGAPPEADFSSNARSGCLLIQEASTSRARTQVVEAHTPARPTGCRPDLPFPLAPSLPTVIQENLVQECDSIFSQSNKICLSGVGLKLLNDYQHLKKPSFVRPARRPCEQFSLRRLRLIGASDVLSFLRRPKGIGLAPTAVPASFGKASAGP